MGKTQLIGKTTEDLACRYLQKQGLKLITRNFRCRVGEIDLIMQDNAVLVFVEVRFRQNNRFGGSIESVNVAKQKKLIKAAYVYLQQQRLMETRVCRFDVIALSSKVMDPQVEWIKNAFTA